jgi:hypothetical protein
MKYKRAYGGIIWTDHALERIYQRKLPQETAFLAYSSPDKRIPGKNPGSTELQKQYGKHLITLIIKPNDKGEQVVISAWIDPPLPGTNDFRKQEYRKNMKGASFWKRVWLTVKNQMGF